MTNEQPDYADQQFEYEFRPFDVQCVLCETKTNGTQQYLTERLGWMLESFGAVCAGCTLKSVRRAIQTRWEAQAMIDRISNPKPQPKGIQRPEVTI